MNITIGQIDFAYVEEDFLDGNKPVLTPVTAHVSYIVGEQGRALEGEIDIPFDAYKEMKHADIVELTKNKVKQITQ